VNDLDRMIDAAARESHELRNAERAASVNGERADLSTVRILPSPSSPMKVARELVNSDYISRDGRLTLRSWRGGWWGWRTSHWVEVEHCAIESGAYGFTEDAMHLVADGDKEKLVRWEPNRHKIGDLRQRVRNLGRRVDAALNGHGWFVDSTALDLARHIRPPGVDNHKPGRDVRPVTVWRGSADGAGDYRLDDLERDLPQLSPQPRAQPRLRSPSRGESIVTKAGNAPWDVFARGYTIDDVLAADPRNQWERVDDQAGMPAWRRSPLCHTGGCRS